MAFSKRLANGYLLERIELDRRADIGARFRISNAEGEQVGTFVVMPMTEGFSWTVEPGSSDPLAAESCAATLVDDLKHGRESLD
jgi:hypothetical protein